MKDKIPWPAFHDHHEELAEELEKENKFLKAVIISLKKKVSELTRGARKANKTLTRTQQKHAAEIKDLHKKSEKMQATLQIIHTWASYNQGQFLEAREVARQTAIALDRPDLLQP